jgi:hypothetical protein
LNLEQSISKSKTGKLNFQQYSICILVRLYKCGQTGAMWSDFKSPRTPSKKFSRLRVIYATMYQINRGY